MYHSANFTLDVSGRTTIGKTTALRVGASVAGNPDQRMADTIIQTWNNTRVYFERLCVVSSDLPVYLDDTKQAKYPGVVGEVLYDHANGHGRGRGNTDGLARSGHWRSVLMSTGEGPAVSFTQDGGTRGRVLGVKGLPFESDNVARLINDLNVGVTANYGHALPLFIRRAMAQQDDWEQWERSYRDEVAVWAERKEGSVAGRLAAYMAAITFTAKLVHCAFADAGCPLPWQYHDQFDELWLAIAAETDDAPAEVRALQDVLSWAMANEGKFWRKETSLEPPWEATGGWLGAWPKEDEWRYIAFLSDPLKEYLGQRDYRPDEIISNWRERHWLVLGKDGKNRQVRFGQNRKPTRMLVLPRTAFVAAGCLEA